MSKAREEAMDLIKDTLNDFTNAELELILRFLAALRHRVPPQPEPPPTMRRVQ